MKKKLFVLLYTVFSSHFLFSQTKALDAKYIASNYYKGVVKILLYDSLAAKQDTSLGYIGRGSGFIVSEDGIVFTNRHVVEMCVQGYINYDYYSEQTNAISTYIETYSQELLNDSGLAKINRIGFPAPIIQVYTGKGEEDYKLYYAKVLSVSMGSFDGAMLQIVSDLQGNPAGNIFQPLPIGNSDSTFQGEDLCVYGYPENYSGGMNMMLKEMSTLTFGKHSGFDFAYSKDFGYIKTEAAINKGNSGGPVFNQENKVIGIATAAFNKTNIGLVGGINAMYYIVAPEIDILQKLSARGLKLPKSAGAIKTINGDRQVTPSQKQIDEINRQRRLEIESRQAALEQKKQLEAMGAYSSSLMMIKPKTKKIIYGGAGASTYKRGTLDLFWQTINGDPALKATGEGSPFVWHAGIQFFFSAKKESKGYGGIGVEYFATSKHAIGAYNNRDHVFNEIKIGLKEILITVPIAYQLNNKMMVLFEPGFIYMGFVRGSITAYGQTYVEKNSLDFGWNVASGINYSLKKHVGVFARTGYRNLKIEETHKDSRGSATGYEYTYSFFANGTDGDNTIINWSGFYLTSGIYFSFDAKPSGNKKKGREKK